MAIDVKGMVVQPCLPRRQVYAHHDYARAARREIAVRVVPNRVKRTSLAKHADAEIAAAKLPRLQASLSDLVAFGELSYSGQVPAAGTAGAEVIALIKELRTLGWLPAARSGAVS